MSLTVPFFSHSDISPVPGTEGTTDALVLITIACLGSY